MIGTILVAVLVMAVLAVAGFYLAQFLYKKDTEIEERRRAAGKLALELSKVGFTRLPEFLIDYSVGDYSSMLRKMKTVAELATGDPAAFMREFEKVGAQLLDAKLKTPEGRILIAAKLQDLMEPSDPTVVKGAPKVEAPAKA